MHDDNMDSHTPSPVAAELADDITVWLEEGHGSQAELAAEAGVSTRMIQQVIHPPRDGYRPLPANVAKLRRAMQSIRDGRTRERQLDRLERDLTEVRALLSRLMDRLPEP